MCMMNEFVTIKREEYESLIADREMLEDIQAYDEAMKDLSEGMPHEFVLRLIVNGENPIAVYRDWRGFNQSSLAKTSGVNRTQIADIEAGRSKPSVVTLKKLAETLDVEMGVLV